MRMPEKGIATAAIGGIIVGADNRFGQLAKPAGVDQLLPMFNGVLPMLGNKELQPTSQRLWMAIDVPVALQQMRHPCFKRRDNAQTARRNEGVEERPGNAQLADAPTFRLHVYGARGIARIQRLPDFGFEGLLARLR